MVLPEARRAVSGDQNNVIVSGGQGYLQHINDDAGGTITLATWYRLAIVELLDDSRV